MGRPGITYHDVAKAADALQIEGVNPTIERVRTKLGTGSNGTITPHLRQWKAQSNDSQQLASKEQLPEPLVTLIKSLWRHMLDDVENQVSIAKKDSEQTIATLKQQLINLETSHQQCQQRYNQLQQTKEEINRDKLTLTAGLSELKQANTVTQVQLENSQKQLQEKQTRIDELNKLHKHAQENLEHYRDSVREQRLKEEQHYEAEKNQCQQTIKNLEINLNVSKEKAFNLKKLYNESIYQHKQVESEFNKLTDNYKVLENNSKNFEKESILYQSETKQLGKENKLLQEKLKIQQAELISVQKELSATSQNLLTETEKNKNLNAQVELLSHEKWILGQEKAQLVGQLRQANMIRDE